VDYTTYLKKRRKRGKPSGVNADSMRVARIEVIKEAIIGDPKTHERALRRLLVDDKKLMQKGTFYKTIRFMESGRIIVPIWKGNKKTFRVIGPDERLVGHATDLANQLEALKGQLYRFVKEYPKKDSVSKIVMVTAHLRNHLEFLDELLLLSILDDKETEQERASIVEVKANMRKILEVVERDDDRVEVFEHVVGAILRKKDLDVVT